MTLVFRDYVTFAVLKETKIDYLPIPRKGEWVSLDNKTEATVVDVHYNYPSETWTVDLSSNRLPIATA